MERYIANTGREGPVYERMDAFFMEVRKELGGHDHEYEIKEGRHKVAQVSKKWFRVRDTYGVEIAPDQEDVVILAVTVALDNMAHSGK